MAKYKWLLRIELITQPNWSCWQKTDDDDDTTKGEWNSIASNAIEGCDTAKICISARSGRYGGPRKPGSLSARWLNAYAEACRNMNARNRMHETLISTKSIRSRDILGILRWNKQIRNQRQKCSILYAGWFLSLQSLIKRGVTLSSTARGNAFLRCIAPFYRVAGYTTSFTLDTAEVQVLFCKWLVL